MNALRQHWARIAITFLPAALALMHVAGIWRLPFIDALDYFIYDARLRATMPHTLDPRIVIVDIDDTSLQQLGQWPWRRDQLAQLTTEVIDRQEAAVLGFDVLFVEPDSMSGHALLRRLEEGPLADKPEALDAVRRFASEEDPDTIFAKSLVDRPVVLGFYFTQSKEPRSRGQLPPPVLSLSSFPADRQYATRWNGFVGSIPQLAQGAPASGFLNVLLDADHDGVVRSVPLIARYTGQAAQPGYYESLALAVFRMVIGSRALVPTFAPQGAQGGAPPLHSLVLAGDAGQVRIPLDSTASVLIPYRGPGGVAGGSFRHVPAVDVIRGTLSPGEFKGKIVLVGSTAPGLEDLRSTPAGAAFPGVEVHANIISGLLDGRIHAVPDYATGYEMMMVLAAGFILAFGLSLGSAQRAVVIAILTVVGTVGINAWLFAQANLVLPVGATLALIGAAFVLNMSWGYLVEARASRRLANLFGTYVPPELVAEMRVDPERYSMRAESRELTVMFCDMRGFTQMAEHMAPVDLQDFLNEIFSRLTEVISAHRGTVDKYIGDCVMAFWGAPVETPNHAELAAKAAIDMVAALRELNEAHRRTGQPQISVGIGLNSGVMSVGDMGSAIRRSYTVVGDAVNLASRIEGLGSHYGVEIVATEATRALSPALVWQELDSVRVQGKVNVVRIFTPVGSAGGISEPNRDELDRWDQVISAYRAQEWQRAQALLAPLLAMDAKKVLYQLYEQRLASLALQPKDPNWDGATRFESK